MIATALARHRVMMSSPELWPCSPFLPLIRTQAGRGLELGVLLAADLVGVRHALVVIRANLLLLPTSRAELLSLPHEEFDSVDRLLAAGWRVD